MSSKLSAIKNRSDSINFINKIFTAVKKLCMSKLEICKRSSAHLHSFITSMEYNKPKLLPMKNNDLIVIFGTDQGLCGNLNLKIKNHIMQYNIKKILCIGKKTYSMLSKIHNNIELIQISELYQRISGINCRVLYYFFHNMFKSELIDEYLINDIYHDNKINKTYSNIDDIWCRIYFNIKIRMCLSESYKSEFSSRMISMDGANKNAKNILEQLKITYNSLRQERITNDITELNAGVEAMLYEE